MPDTWILYSIRQNPIVYNPAKNNCICSTAHPNSLPGIPLHFMNTHHHIVSSKYLLPSLCACLSCIADIVFVPSCTFLGISVSSQDISDRNIPQSVQNVYRRYNDGYV